MAELPTAICAALETIVGAEHVHVGTDGVAPHSRDIGPWRTEAAAVVEPASADEVAGIVGLAREPGLRLWTFSGGWNWGYGAAMGLYDGALIMLLRRMNRILEVNAELAYAVIEPGVTQAQLRAHLDAIGSGLWTDSTDSTPKGSVIGNALEHGVGYTPLCDHFGALCGLEVVLADGSVVRTGGGSARAKTWHTHRWGLGPSVDGLFGQSNFGVVTKAGIWLMPKPDRSGLVLLELDDDASLAQAIDALRELSLRREIPANIHVVNDILLAAILDQYPEDLLEPGARRLSARARTELRARYNIAPFSITLGVYGTEAQVRAQRRVLRERLGDLGRLTMIGTRLGALLPKAYELWRSLEHIGPLDRALRALTHASAAKLRATTTIFDLLQGTPREFVLGFAYFKARERRPEVDLDPARDGGGMIWLPCVLPLTGRDVEAVMKLARPLYARHGFDYSNTFISINRRTTMSLMQIFFDIDDPDARQRALALQAELFEATEAAGYPQYRTGHAFHERLFEQAPGYRALIRKLKQALDPDDILAPGRYGTGGASELDS